MPLTPHRPEPDPERPDQCRGCNLPTANLRAHPVDPRDDATDTVLARVTDNAAPVGRNHPETSKRAAALALPRTGTLRAEIFALIAARPVTDDEIEVALVRSHQSASASRNSLMNDGLIEPLVDADGHPVLRTTRSGNEATVWTLTRAARAYYAPVDA